MKKLIPLALIGAAVGAVAYVVKDKNEQHIAKTIDALDEISQEAEQTVKEMAEKIQGEEA